MWIIHCSKNSSDSVSCSASCVLSCGKRWKLQPVWFNGSLSQSESLKMFFRNAFWNVRVQGDFSPLYGYHSLALISSHFIARLTDIHRTPVGPWQSRMRKHAMFGQINHTAFMFLKPLQHSSCTERCFLKSCRLFLFLFWGMWPNCEIRRECENWIR